MSPTESTSCIITSANVCLSLLRSGNEIFTKHKHETRNTSQVLFISRFIHFLPLWLHFYSLSLYGLRVFLYLLMTLLVYSFVKDRQRASEHHLFVGALRTRRKGKFQYTWGIIYVPSVCVCVVCPVHVTSPTPPTLRTWKQKEKNK